MKFKRNFNSDSLCEIPVVLCFENLLFIPRVVRLYLSRIITRRRITKLSLLLGDLAITIAAIAADKPRIPRIIHVKQQQQHSCDRRIELFLNESQKSKSMW